MQKSDVSDCDTNYNKKKINQTTTKHKSNEKRRKLCNMERETTGREKGNRK